MLFLAPAKINLSLHVVRRRDDGFHDIDSLMVPISIFDKLEIELRDEGGLQFTCDDSSIPTDDKNLVVRAASHFCTEIGLEPHLRIHLEKHIPHGAGLGGGSSDAAITLIGLNHLFRTELPRETLLSLAADLGSDVPFFILGRPAQARGRGEKLESASFNHRLALLLIKPSFGVSTPWAYQRWRNSRELPGIPYSPQILPWGELVNDLERPVFEKFLFLATLKKWLLEQEKCAAALMSGSGSTVFAILHNPDDAAPLGKQIAQEFGTELWCHAAETLVP
jgi:4-diphosphocytidyl-2-C-methyl-D-erythritol kinase